MTLPHGLMQGRTSPPTRSTQPDGEPLRWPVILRRRESWRVPDWAWLAFSVAAGCGIVVLMMCWA